MLVGRLVVRTSVKVEVDKGTFTLVLLLQILLL
jgi:hypothetical protein